MKKTLLFLFISICSLSNAQIGQLLGMTAAGGQNNGGTVFNYDPLTSRDSVFVNFPGSGLSPYSKVVQASDGNFYGMTSQGGSHDSGTIYKCTPSGVVTILVNLNNKTGGNPDGALIQATDGNLYGLTSEGGTSGQGTLFKCTTTGILTTIVNYTGTNGSSPWGSLLQASDGNLYGETYSGGSGYGTIFKCTTAGTLTTIFSFSGTNGTAPLGNLIQGFDGNLYGIAGGSPPARAVIFKCSTTGTYTILYTLSNASSNELPSGSLIQAADSNLYGIIAGGGTSGQGLIFKCTTKGGFSSVYNFTGSADGGDVWYGSTTLSLMQASDSYLYGMTYSGGAAGDGTIFKCSTSGTLTTIANFNGINGNEATGALIMATDGNFYGVTSFGGIGYGNIFKCSTSGTITQLYAFAATPTGYDPNGCFMQASNGSIYGISTGGGSQGFGSVFAYNNITGGITNIVSLNDTNGRIPYGALVEANGGNLYGTTSYGGANGDGTIIQYNPFNGQLTKIVDFNYTNGSNPAGSLILATDGNLYGMTTYGGTPGDGTIFKCTTSGVITTLVNFDSINGADPFLGGLIQAPDGNLYGLTQNGGTANDGTLFKCTLSGTITRLVSFTGTANGANPYGSLVLGTDGNLYGTTSSGGSLGYGTLFKCTTSGVLTTLVNFSGTNGKSPAGSLIQATDGNLYGMTTQGGTSNDGTLFKCTTSGTVTTLVNFKSTNGYEPYGNSLLEVMSATITNNTSPCGVTLTTNVRGAVSPFTYSWSSGATTSGIIPVKAGNYVDTVTDAKGIKILVSATTTYNALTLYVPSTPACGGNNGSAIANVTGGTSPYTYSWNTGPTTQSINNLASGSYTVTVTDNYGCIDINSATISSGILPAITITGDSTICSGSYTKLTANGATAYTWAPSASLTNITSTTVYAQPVVNTTYTVIGTNASGCSNKDSITVTVVPTNGFDLTGNLQICIDTPSFNSASIQACIFNNRCLPVNGTLKLLLDTALHFTSTIADSNAHISGDTLIWNFDSLSDISKTQCVSLNGTISNLPVGDSVFVSMFITPVLGDSNPANNSITYWVKAFPYNCVGIPFDPNEKSVSPIGDIADTQKLTYTIHFQNTGTAIAHNVVVIDTLSANLDATTLKTISASNDVSTQIVSGHIVKFIFDNINLPDTGTSKTTSIGLFTYTVKPLAGLSPGDQIINRAGIYFDSNPVVTTNKTVNTVAGAAPLGITNIATLNMACFPNPFTNSTSVVFNKAGQHYLELYDAVGRKIETITCVGTQYELQRGSLASGIYFIKAFNQDNSSFATNKIVIE